MHSVKFPKHGHFREVLEERIEIYFQSCKLPKRDHPLMYTKATIMILWAVASYIALIFFPLNLFSAALIALSLALALVGIGFNVQHDGNHDGFSRHAWVNRLAGWSLDLIGASSYFWKTKHNTLHHTYTNIEGKDDDINLSFLGRLSPAQKKYWFHKYQHLYLWFFYGFVHVRYLFMDIYRFVFKKVGGETVKRPKNLELFWFIAGKISFVTLAFVVPCLFYPWWLVVIFYLSISICMGLLFSVVFQMAHMVEKVEHPGSVVGVTEHEFVIHQIQTTANFAPKNRLWTFFLGGLNFQREHHLFPKVSHVHYPALATIVQRVCKENNVRYFEYPSVTVALCSHYRFLKRMGRE